MEPRCSTSSSPGPTVWQLTGTSGRGRRSGRRRRRRRDRGWQPRCTIRRSTIARSSSRTVAMWPASWWLVGSSASSTIGSITAARAKRHALLLTQRGVGRGRSASSARPSAAAPRAPGHRPHRRGIDPSAATASATFSVIVSSAIGAITCGRMAVPFHVRSDPGLAPWPEAFQLATVRVRSSRRAVPATSTCRFPIGRGPRPVRSTTGVNENGCSPAPSAHRLARSVACGELACLRRSSHPPTVVELGDHLRRHRSP